MIRTLNLTSLAIGTAALLVGLTGNVQAIPITLNDQIASQSARSLNQSQQNKNFTSLATTPTSKVAKTKKTSGSRKSNSGLLPRITRGGLVPVVPVVNPGVLPVGGLTPGTPLPLPETVLTQPLSSGPSTLTPQVDSTSAPDGGMTATLLGGTFCGLVFLRRKLKA